MRIGITKTNRKPVPNYYNNFKILIQRQKYSFCFKPQSRVPRQRRRTKLPDTSILATELKKKKKKKDEINELRPDCERLDWWSILTVLP